MMTIKSKIEEIIDGFESVTLVNGHDFSNKEMKEFAISGLCKLFKEELDKLREWAASNDYIATGGKSLYSVSRDGMIKEIDSLIKSLEEK